MIPVETVCNEIINRSIQENIDLTPLKLQKIIYFIYGYGLQRTNELLFSADFYAWKYGPVCEPIYQEFKSFGEERITRYSQDAKGLSYFPNWEAPSNNNLLLCLNEVWNKYKNYSGFSLVKLTHQETSAWCKANTNDKIADENIKIDIARGLY